MQEITRTATTAIGQRIALPADGAEVIASIYTIAPGAALPVHKHRFPRYVYVLSGQVEVRTEDGTVFTYEAGALIVGWSTSGIAAPTWAPNPRDCS